ncbi:MAG: DUF1641 domain-containing protein [Gammaproteobacteria bacterium]|nr:DUF1641 domain-containing protein [Gammaproteobacteria bacterium]
MKTSTTSTLSQEVGLGLQGAVDALTDQMVERLATTAGNVGEIVDRLNDPDTRDAVHSLLDELTSLHRAGGLTSLFELVHLANAVRNAATDGIVERLAGFTEHMVTNVANEETADLFQTFATALSDAQQQAAEQPARGGLVSAVRLLSAPETQDSLRFLLTFARGLKAGTHPVS